MKGLLRADLKRLGHHFRSKSDTEVVLHAYIEWGKDALEKFVGMFALAILDLKENKLFLARDHFGIKPLYYASEGGLFAFASEIKAILRIPSVSRQADPQVVYNFLRYGRTSYHDATFLADVKTVPPATYLEVPFEAGRAIESRVYWQPTVREPMDLSFSEAARGLQDLLIDSVGIHLRSDVPVGMALSGGIDSSSITACVRGLQPDVQLHTFTYVSNERLERDWPYAAKVAEHVDAIQHRIHLSTEDLLQDLDALVYMQDQPMRNTNMFAQYMVYKLASQHSIKVMLDGQGADELMAGYPYYYIPYVKSMIKRGEWLKLVRFLIQATARQEKFPLKSTVTQASFRLLPLSAQSVLANAFEKDCKSSWIHEKWIQRYNLQCNVAGSKDMAGLKEALVHSLMVDSLPRLLRYQDRNSMAHSVESRVPFLHPRLTEYVMNLPQDYLIGPDGTRKSIIREAMRGIVPDLVLDRQDKIGYGSPMMALLQDLMPWIEKLLDSDTLSAMTVLDADGLRRHWHEVRNGHHAIDGSVWRWINLIKWAEHFDVRFDA